MRELVFQEDDLVSEFERMRAFPDVYIVAEVMFELQFW